MTNITFSPNEEIPETIKNFKYDPSLNNDDNINMITKAFNKYKYSPYKSNDKICEDREFKLLNHQKFVSQYVSKVGNLLVYHGLGSGKTCTSILASEMFKPYYFTDSDRKKINQRNKVIYVSRAELIESTKQELLGRLGEPSCSSNIKFDGFPQDYKNVSLMKRIKAVEDNLKKNPNKDDEAALKMLKKQVLNNINSNYEFYSYEAFRNRLFETDDINHNNWKYSPGDLLKPGKPLTKPGTILVIDEIQNVISETGTTYQKLLTAIKYYFHKDTRIVLLTATPIFNRPFELALVMNLIDPKKSFPTTNVEFEKKFIDMVYDKEDRLISKNIKNEQKLIEMCNGYVSYFAGGNPDAYPYIINTVVQSPMSDFQMRNYRAVLMTEVRRTYKKPEDIIGKLIGDVTTKDNMNLFTETKQTTNVCEIEKLLSQLKKPTNKENIKSNMALIKKHSNKFYRIIQLINGSKRPVFVHTNYVLKGADILEKCLISVGYGSFGSKGAGKNRVAKWIGDIKLYKKEQMKDIFNSDENKKCQLIKVLIGTVKEGLSLKNVGQVHLIDPWWNMSKLKQIAARAVRYKSHCSLEPKDRYIHIFTHLSVFPDKTKGDPKLNKEINEVLSTVLKGIPADRKNRQASRNISLNVLKKATIDQTMYRKANEKDILSKQFENVLKTSAVDRELNKSVNVLPIEEFFWQHPMNNTFVSLKRNPVNNLFYLNNVGDSKSKNKTIFGASQGDKKKFLVNMKDILSMKHSDFNNKYSGSKTYPKYGIYVTKGGDKIPSVDIKEPTLSIKTKNNTIREDFTKGTKQRNEGGLDQYIDNIAAKNRKDMKNFKKIYGDLLLIKTHLPDQYAKLMKNRVIDQEKDKMIKKFIEILNKKNVV